MFFIVLSELCLVYSNITNKKTERENEMRIEKYPAGKNIFAFGAMDEEEGLVGVVFARIADATIEIEYISVLEEYQRQGIGRMLVEAVLAFAKEADRNYMVLFLYPNDVSHANMRGFIDKLGVFEALEIEEEFENYDNTDIMAIWTGMMPVTKGTVLC